jgi:hypothetical protein
MATKRWGTGSRQDDFTPEDDPNRVTPYEAGPTGAAAGSSELRGDPDAGDPAAGGQGGALGGAIAGTSLGGPVVGAIGAAVGGVAGTAAEGADDDSSEQVGKRGGAIAGGFEREPKRAYGHEIEVRRGSDENPAAGNPTES